MRLFEHYANLRPRYHEAYARDRLRASNLVAARLEMVYTHRFEGYLDLAFERDGSWLIVPLVRIDGGCLMVQEASPLIWPAEYAYASDAVDEIEELVIPWLRSVVIARLVNDEFIRVFRDEPTCADVFRRARRSALLGSAPYADVFRTLGAAVYGARFARERNVVLRGSDAANGAAMLSSFARRIAWTCEDDDVARTWFSGLSTTSIEGDGYDLYVGPRDGAIDAHTCVFDDAAREGERRVVQPEPMPADVLVSFDPEDGLVMREFAVTESAVPLRGSRLFEPSRAGASAGRIAIVVRDDAERAPDADSDAAHELARSLQAEGFDARVDIASHIDAASVDVIHVFDLRHGVSVIELARDAEAAGTPIVVTSYADDRAGEVGRGISGALAIPRMALDRLVFDETMHAFEARRISNLDNDPWYGASADLLMQRAAAVVVASNAEALFLQERFGYRGVTVPVAATVPLTRPTDRIGSLVGNEEFVLIHAPLEPRANQLAATVAAERRGIRLVLVGPVADVEYQRYVNQAAGRYTIQLRDSDLTPEELAGLYARARVVADVGWSSRGLHRLARGAAHGAAVVASVTGYAHDLWAELAFLVDPANVGAIGEALHRAWEAQPQLANAIAARTAERCDPFAGLVAVVSAYGQASVPNPT